MMKYLFCFVLVLVCLSAVYADDGYKPYLHQANLPDHPEVRLFGEYSTSLYSGAATYSYPIEVPKGVNGLQPVISVFYNSQQQAQSVLGAGWDFNQDLIYRDINGTIEDTDDDFFFMVLDGNLYKLVYRDGEYRSEVDYYYRIQRFSDSWLVTKQDGTQYVFGNASDARLASNDGAYVNKWYLHEISDTFNNKITYAYKQDLFAEDHGVVYLDKILYNSDERRVIQFSYEHTVRPDSLTSYAQGHNHTLSRRLEDISILLDGELVKRHHFSYQELGPARSGVQTITLFGSDNSSMLYELYFSYHNATNSYHNASVWTPPVLFSDDDHFDYGVRLVDVNNDGFMDLIQSNYQTENIWLNDKQGNWTLTTSWSFPIDIVETSSYVDAGVRFADVNKDGLQDFIVAKDGQRAVYLHNGTGWTVLGWVFPLDIVDGNDDDLGVRLADINNDGYPDIVKGKENSHAVYLYENNGWTLSDWQLPVDITNDEDIDQGVRFVDLNNDGYTDFVQGINSNKKAYINTGSTFVEDSVWAPPQAFTTSTVPDTGVRFADMNGDGFVDLVVDEFNGTSERGVWFNTGHGWIGNASWQAPEAFTDGGYNIGRRIADVNGDGLPDLVVSHEESEQQYTVVKNASTAYLLSSITNAYGGKTRISYAPSTALDNQSLMGFPVLVVKQKEFNNNLSGAFSINGSVSYTYAGAAYDYADEEFRGFHEASEQTSSALHTYQFYQDDSRKGIVHEQALADSEERLFSKKVSAYNYSLAGGVYNLSLLYVSDFLYDGALEAQVTNRSYYYNRFGNYEYVVDHGDIGIEGDERYHNYSYAINTDEWIVNKLARETVYDAFNNQLRESRYYYDNLGLGGVMQGALSKVVQWNDLGNDSVTTYAYERHGNLIAKTDSLGNKERYTYDPYNTYLTSVSNPLQHSTRYEYDVATGNLLWTEQNGVRTTSMYDTFGRLSRVVLPYDTDSMPTKKMHYLFDGIAPEIIVEEQKTTANKTLRTAYYYDGLSNLIQAQADADAGAIVKNFFYDNSSRVIHEQQPYVAARTGHLAPLAADAYNTSYAYDCLGRVVQVTNPDGSHKNVSFDRYNVTAYDELGHEHRYVVSARGLIDKVFEYNTNDAGVAEVYQTTYAYDGNDNLVGIIDDAGNAFSFTYDSLGRKVAMVDPDLGSWSYAYDQSGNLVSQEDARGARIDLRYDALGRVVEKGSADTNTTFTYDTAYQGTLARVTVNDDLAINFTYDDRLRVIKEEQDIAGVSFVAMYAYDSADRVISRDGFASDLDYLYNTEGLVKEIPGFLTEASYTAFGGLRNKSYQNGLVTSYSYSDTMKRLERILVPTVQDLSYTYDAVGNIRSLVDAEQNLTSTMSYDALDRLRTVTRGDDTYRYGFNSIGNLLKIVKNDEAKYYTYQGSTAHAPSRISEGNAGVTVSNPHEIDSGSLQRVYEFWLVNDQDTSEETNITVLFGDGASHRSGVLNVSDTAWAFIAHNYSAGGSYALSFVGEEHAETLQSRFGMFIEDLHIISQSYGQLLFELVAAHDLAEGVRNVSWQCSENMTALLSADMSDGQSLYAYIGYNYTTPGEKLLICNISSVDGNDTARLAFTIDGFAIESFDTLIKNASRRVLSFDLNNRFTQTNANVSIAGEDAEIMFAAGETVMAFVEDNASTDGIRTFTVNVSSGTYSDSFEDQSYLSSVSLHDYVHISAGLSHVLGFTVTNTWSAGTVNWTLSEVGISNASYLEQDESLLVFIEEDFDEGVHKPVISAQRLNTMDLLGDYFIVRPLDFVYLNVLSEGDSAVSELFVQNHAPTWQLADWSFTHSILISNNETMNISDSAFVFIESSQATGVHTTEATINSSSYTDEARGVIVNG